MVAMSGSYTQRGEPAITDKWSRTRMALANGVDLVLELPFAYACSSAERFADGGVRLLQATGLDSQLVFGSESGDLDRLSRRLNFWCRRRLISRTHLHAFLAEGLSFYPLPVRKPWRQVSGDNALAGLLSQSNNILAVEYLKAIRRLPSFHLRPVTIRRLGTGRPFRKPAGHRSAARRVGDPHGGLAGANTGASRTAAVGSGRTAARRHDASRAG
jgi:predicted nucleotidyltransferase